jgi:hypothetical protein
MGTGGPFPVATARPERDADHSPPSSDEVENEDLYFLSLPRASVACSGTALSLALITTDELQISYIRVRFQVLTAASIKFRVFWDAAPCSYV